MTDWFTVVQTCVILIRNTFRLSSRRYRDELKRDIELPGHELAHVGPDLLVVPTSPGSTR